VILPKKLVDTIFNRPQYLAQQYGTTHLMGTGGPQAPNFKGENSEGGFNYADEEEGKEESQEALSDRSEAQRLAIFLGQ